MPTGHLRSAGGLCAVALAAFIRPETSSEVNVDVANWGTLTGALCFAVGGVMQGFDRPSRQTG